MSQDLEDQLKKDPGQFGQGRKIRVLLTKSRMDAHDRGVRYVARELSRAGVEAIFTRYALPEEIVDTAVQEAVDFVGVSCSTGGHLHVAEKIQEALEAQGITDIKVIFGGIIPDMDATRLKSMGVTSIFGPGSSIKEILNKIFETFPHDNATCKRVCS